MLFQVLYMYSITTNNKHLSGDVSCSMLCLLAAFIAYTAHTTVLLSPLPPPDVFSCLDSLLFFLLMSFRLFLKSHSGTAGRQSSLVIHGADFSTKDMDNDNCMCKCALMLTGGKCNNKQNCCNHAWQKRKPKQPPGLRIMQVYYKVSKAINNTANNNGVPTILIWECY